MERLLVVVPAYNEEASIGTVLTEIRAVVPDAGVLVVDDGSSDDTRRVAVAASAAVLSLPFNLGVGGAMRAGFRYAVRNGYTQVVQVDADGQHDPKQIPMLVRELAGADIVIGARFAGVVGYPVRGPRRWAMRLLASHLSRLTRARLTDVTSGFRASGPRAVELFAKHYPVEYLGDTVESLVVAALAGLRSSRSRSACACGQPAAPARRRSGRSSTCSAPAWPSRWTASGGARPAASITPSRPRS